jgi:outer membrane lipopolysaccharide assembly protein LptE/RlpB
MKTLASLTLCLALSACGAEVAGTAAIQAEARKKEMEAAKEIEAQYRQQTEQAMQQSLQRLKDAEGKTP